MLFLVYMGIKQKATEVKLITTHGLLSWWSKTKTECYSSIEVFRVDILLHLKKISTLFSFLLLLLLLLLSFIDIYCLTNIFLGHENHKKQGLCLSEKSLYAELLTQHYSLKLTVFTAG